ncbi:hypothetical protein MMC29_003038, partial [Sticta canariensis]|nr:hypothetical protein [Sticta canariensis]
MTQGGCLCGICTTLLSGEPKFKALCYCKDCRRISGSPYSTNLVVAHEDYQLISGTPKQYSKPTDAGNTITSNFCGDCGITLWRETTGAPGMKLIKAGKAFKIAADEGILPRSNTYHNEYNRTPLATQALYQDVPFGRARVDPIIPPGPTALISSPTLPYNTYTTISDKEPLWFATPDIPLGHVPVDATITSGAPGLFSSPTSAYNTTISDVEPHYSAPNPEGRATSSIHDKA